MEELNNAIAGKTASAGGLNLKEFKEALIKKYPRDAALINSFNRAQLEEHYKTKGAEKEKPKYVDPKNNITFVYAGKFYKRFFYTEPLMFEIKVNALKVPDKIKHEWFKNDDSLGIEKMINSEKMITTAKSEIDKYYNEKSYATITNIIEYYKKLKYTLQNKYHINYVTNAWLKMYEMLHYLPLVEDNDKPLYVFHNCELPGAFIQATTYYMKHFRPKRAYDWRASSLVIHDKDNNKANALDDHYGLWKANRDKWIMSLTDPEINGDTTKVKNIHYMEKTIGRKVDLYTSDAGISTGFESHKNLAFNEQEQLNMLINLGQILAMLETLKIGGCFITKQYTFFKPFTYTLMMIVASMFDKFYITKPLTSKPTNSETYLAGIGFKGISDEWKKYLEDTLSSYTSVVPMPGPLLPAETAKDNSAAIDAIVDAADKIYTVQAELVKSNVEIYEDFRNFPTELDRCVREQINKIENNWIVKFKV
jgi:hypothetical protein